MKRLMLFAFSLGMVGSTIGAAGAQYTIPHIATADLPTIDGVVSDWEALFGAPHFAQADFSSGAGISGAVPESDQKVEVWVGWNQERNLIYVGARVTDNLYGTTTSNGPGDVWKSDDIEVGIDADNSKGANDNGHAQWYMLNPEGKYGAVLNNLNNEMSLVEPPLTESAVTRTGTVYQYELAIPGWDIDDNAVERHAFAVGAVIGLALVFADFESDAAADAGNYHAYNVLDGQGGGLAFNADRYPEFRLEAPKVDIAVTTTADRTDFSGAQQVGDLPGPDGVVSLREAITAANKTTGPQTIGFRIPTSDAGFDGVVFRIQPTTTLPPITGDGTVIDGATQANFTGDTNPVGPEIVLDGAGAGRPVGIRLGGDNCQVNSLVIQHCSSGIALERSNQKVANCFVGTDHTGTVSRGNEIGINSFAQASVIENNLISGNERYGIILASADHVVHGNLIGTDLSGTRALPNDIGVYLFRGNLVGGKTPQDRNIISANRIGVVFYGQEIRIQGNYIGTTIGGDKPLGNDYGIVGEQNNTQGAIGGRGVGEGNTVAYNKRIGILIQPQGGTVFKGSILQAFTGNTISISGNSILGNGELGIDLAEDGPTPNDPGDTDAGPNALMNYPVLSSAVVSGTTLTVEGTLDTQSPETKTVEFFANPVPTPGGDASGYGEGAIFLGTATPDAAGKIRATFPAVAVGTLISATATDAAGNTSEFARNVAVIAGSTETPANPALEAPQLSSPADGATDQPVGEDQPRLFLRWAAVEGATSYQVMVDEAADFASPVLDRSVSLGTAVPLDNKDYGTTYYWRVRAVDERGPGPWSEIWQFTTEQSTPDLEPTNPALAAPGLTSPQDGETNLPGSSDRGQILLRWTALAGATSYQVMVDDRVDFSSPILDRSNITGSTVVTLSNRRFGTTYYWRVRAANADGPGEWSEVWSFSTEAAPAVAPAPELVSPANGATNQPLSLTLEWRAVAGASRYELQWSASSGFSSPDVMSSTTTSYRLNNLRPGITYSWHVRAVGGNWSAVWKFTTEAGEAAVISVTTTADQSDFGGARQVTDLPGPDGVVSLREAILAANLTAGPQTIGFAIPTSDAGFDGVVYRIQPTTTLPSITGGGTSIDGDTQAELTGDTNPVGPEIVLDGSLITGVSDDDYVEEGALMVHEAADCWINRIVVQSFYPLNGISARGSGSRNTKITNCFVGTDHTGTLSRGNRNGVFFNVNASLVEGNLISGNIHNGLVPGSDSNIRGNLIGTDITGSKAVSNGYQGVYIFGSNNVIGGPTTSARNIISGNSNGGILVGGTGNRVQGNYIGVGVDGQTRLGNADFGIVTSGQTATALVGGSSPGEGNIIAYNRGEGVLIQPQYETTPFTGVVTISGNSIFGNGELGIDLKEDGPTPNDSGDIDTGANALMNFPVLIAAVVSGTTLAVEGILETSSPETATVEFFANPVPNPGGDASGYGEGAVFLGTATPDASGKVSATFPAVAVGTLISATARDAAGHTSEFALNLAVSTGVVEAPAIPALAAPQLSSPANGATDQPVGEDQPRLFLRWAAIEGATSYQVMVDETTGFTSPLLNRSVSLGTSAPLDGRAYGTTYFWRVRAANAKGSGAWSEVWQFTTQPAPGSEPVNAPPVARAGADQTVEAGATVQLDGSASSDAEGKPLTYRWSAPAGISLSSTAAVRPTFTASAAGTYRFTLVVNDGQADSAPDEVVVVVNPPVVNPPANTAPIAHAGIDQNVEVGATVQLDGSTSSDAEGKPLTYRWTAPQGITLSSTTTAQPSFTALAAGTYRFSLVVNDGEKESGADEVVVVVREASLKAPEAPQLASPANGSEHAFPTGLSLGWSASADAVSYRVQVDAEPDFASPLLDRSGLAVTSVATSGLSYGTTYYWRVRANNTAGTSPWAATWSFVIKGKLPGLPAEPIQIYEIDPPPDLHDGSIDDWIRAGIEPFLDSEYFAPVPGIGEASGINHADLGFRMFLGWNRQAQKIYMAIERVDDVHIGNYPGDKPGDIWRYDGVELLVDGDRSGGAYNWPEGEGPTDEAERKGLVNSQAQQYQAVPQSPDGHILTYTGIAAGVDQDWMIQLPYADAGGTAEGEGPTTVVIEMAVTAWDTLNWQRQSSSKASVLAPDKLIGLQISVPDFDTEPGAYRGFYTIGGLADTWRNADVFAEAVLLGEGPVGPALSPGTPTLVSPASGDRIQAAEVSLSWQADDLSSSYDVQLSTDASFATVVINTNTRETSLLASDLKENTTYYWRVMGRLGVASGGVGDWSEVRSFTVEGASVPLTPPVANAGADQTVEVGATVQLDGSGSSDAEGSALTYRWTAPSDITLSSTTTPQPTFTASAAVTYRFSLVVNDGQADSAPDEVVVVIAQPVVVPPANNLPQAQAGMDLVTTVGTTVQLDGGGSSDAEGALAGYVWTQVAGPAASLSDVQSAAPTFVPGQPGVYRFELSVSDAQSASAVDQVSVIVLPQVGVRISRENVVQVQTLLAEVLTSTAAKGPGIHLGAYSGQVVVALASAKPAQTDLGLQYDLAYDNYSDDGELVVDGAVRYTQTAEEIRYAGDLELFGQYTGQVDLDVQVGEAGPTGTVKTDEVVYALEEVADVLPPSAPIDLTVPGVTGEVWSTKADFSLQWTSPEDPAGIARVHYKVGAAPTSNEDQTGSVEGVGPLQITLTEQGVILVHVWLEDQAGNLDFAQHTTVTLRYDATPPALNWTPPESLPLGRDLKVSVQATEVSGVASAALYYRQGGQSVYQSVPLQLSAGSEYAATLPGSAIGYAGVQYYVQVQDLVGLGATLPTAGEAAPWTAPVRFQDFVRDSAYPTEVWRMVSVPVQPSNGSPFEVLTALGAYDINQWRLYRYFQGRYQELTQTDIGTFAPGRAFWLHTRIAGIKLHSGGGQTVPLGQSVELSLEPGWNDLAVPFAFAVRWDDVMAASGDPAGVAGPFAYDGNSWAFPTPSERLEPWEGYAVKNSNATSVVLKVPARAAEVLGKPLAKELVEPEWVLQVRVEGTEGGDVHNYLGFRPDAQPAWDHWDLPEPPPAPGNRLRLYFPHGEWAEYPDLYTSDFRPGAEGQMWDFTIEGQGRASLSFAGVEQLPAGLAAHLLDQDGKIFLELREGVAYPVALSGEGQQRHFRVVVGSGDYLAEVCQEYQTLPADLRLLPSQPNPFNPQTQISYQLPRQSPVRLAIYDVLGRQVVVLADEMMDAGYFTVPWDGRDQAGRRVGSGVYFAVLQIPGVRQVQKMLLVR